MSYFLDSSAIFKRYHQEPGSSWIWDICKSNMRSSLYLSAIAEVELTVALRRIAHLESLHSAWADTQINRLLRDMARHYVVIDLDAPKLRLARLLASKHTGIPALRSLGAVQLACALYARQIDSQLTFVVADARLGLIARREGLDVIDPAHP